MIDRKKQKMQGQSFDPHQTLWDIGRKFMMRVYNKRIPRVVILKVSGVRAICLTIYNSNEALNYIVMPDKGSTQKYTNI